MAKNKGVGLDTVLSMTGIVVGIVGSAITLYTYRGSLLAQARLLALAKGQLVEDEPEPRPQNQRSYSFDRRDFKRRGWGQES